jgi:hypothetical protein
MTTEVPVQQYVTRRLSASNIKDLYILHRAVYQKNAPPDYFEKKYDTAYTGKSCLGYLAYNQQQVPVGFYGVQPCFIQLGSKIYLAAQSGDTMTHPQFRFKGLFVDLSRQTFALCKQEELSFLFGFPNQNSYHGAVKHLGWQMIDTMQCYAWHVHTAPLAKWAGKTSVGQKLYGKYAKAILQKHTNEQPGLINPAFAQNKGGVLRSEAYFLYKSYNQTYVVQIGNAKVWIKLREELFIGDMQPNGESIADMLHSLKRLAGKLGIRKMYFHCSSGTDMHALLKKQYQGVPSFPVLIQDLGTDIPFEELKFTLSDIDIF